MAPAECRLALDRADGCVTAQTKPPSSPKTTSGRALAADSGPDSGRAWLMLAVVFLINSTVGGSSRAYGLVYAKQVALAYYDREAASWPIATASTAENLAGILTPALAQFLSWRQIQLLSTSLFVLANLGAYWSRSLVVDILCLGLVQGLALSMCTLMTLTINNHYFERFRTTAYGLAMCGGTCGVLYLGPLLAWILERSDADFRQAYLALALVFALNYPLALLVAPRPQSSEIALATPATPPSASPQRKRSRFESHFERKSSVASIHIECKLSRHSDLRSCCSCRHEATGSAAASEQKPEKSSNQPGEVVLRLDCQCLFDQLDASDLGKLSSACMGVKRKATPPASKKPPPPPPPSDDTFSRALLGELVRGPYLHCVWLMLTLYYLVSRIFIIVLADFATDRGLAPDAAQSLLNYWSAGEVCGRILLCSFVDLQWISVRNCITLTCGSLAAAIALMVQLDGYYLYAVCLLIIAALASLECVLVNVLIIEYLGRHRLTSCYALGSLIAAPLLLLRPTLIGLFRDRLGSYDGLLLLLAGVSAGFALLFALLEPLAARRWPKRAGQ